MISVVSMVGSLGATLCGVTFRKDDLQDKDTMYNSKKYVLKSVEMEEADASGVYAKKATPYLVKERFFYGIRMTKIYVLSN